MGRLKSGLSEGWLVVIKGSLVYKFRPRFGFWVNIHKKRLKVYVVQCDEISPIFEYTVTKSDPPEICYGRKVCDIDFEWMLRRGELKEEG